MSSNNEIPSPSRDHWSKIKEIDSIVIFSTADWDNPFWTNKQHMAVQFAKLGFKILYIESLGLRKVTVAKSDLRRIGRRILRFFRGARLVSPNIWVYSPIVLPFQESVWAQRLNKIFLQTMIRYFKWRLGFKKTLGWTYNPLVREILQSLSTRGIIYHSVDDLSAAPRLPKEKIDQEEQELIRVADAVFVTSRTLAQKYESLCQNKLFYYPNVAEYEHFSRANEASLEIPADVAVIPGPRIGFIGAISNYKLDFDLIAEAASLTPHWNWILLGKVGEGDPMTDASVLNRPNIHLIGPRPYRDLPAYLKAFDVVTIPAPINDYTRSMFPMKFFEYLAAGKVIVASDLPSLSEFKDAFLVASSAQDMIHQIECVLQGKISYSPQMASLAQEHTWPKRLEKMLGDLNNVMEQ